MAEVIPLQNSSFSAIILALALVIIISVIAIILEITVKKKVKKVETEQASASTRLAKLLKEKKQTKEKLRELDIIAKDFFSRAYGISASKSYPELAEEFRSSGNETAAEFCDSMSQLYYLESRINEEKVRYLALALQVLVKRAELTGFKKARPASELQVERKIYSENLEKISLLRREAQRLLKSIQSDRNLRNLSEKKPGSRKEALALLSDNRANYQKLKEYSVEIKKVHEEFSSLVEKAHHLSDEQDSRRIEKIIRLWGAENKKVTNNLNPFRVYILELQILEKYLSSLGIILSRAASNNR